MKTHNTISITVDGLALLVTAQSFSVDRGQNWRVSPDGVSRSIRDAISAAMREAARRDACDPEILEYRRRPTTREMPACNEDVIGEGDDQDDRDTVRPSLPPDMIPTLVPTYGGAPWLRQRDEDDASEVPTERPAVTEPVRSEERPLVGVQASPAPGKASGAK